jgi:hypothetical protein
MKTSRIHFPILMPRKKLKSLKIQDSLSAGKPWILTENERDLEENFEKWKL